LNDGICDCCDGSDETNTGSAADDEDDDDGPGAGTRTKCPNTCDFFQQTNKKKLFKELEMTQRAIEIRNEYIKKAPSYLENFKRSYQKLFSLLQRLQQYFQQRQQAIQSSQSSKYMQELEAIYQHLNEINYLTYVAKRVHETSFGEQEEFAALVGQCFDFVVNEKQLKGGTSNVIPREYIMIFCPFQNITQTEPSYSKWKRLEQESKQKYVEKQEKQKDIIEQQRPILLGIWNRWINLPQDQTIRFLDQFYDQGDVCSSINNKQQHRIVHVEFFCGDKNQVLQMNEHEMCVYSLDFQTPAACKPSYIKEIQQEIDGSTGTNSHSSSSHSEHYHIHEEL
jgi:hypothetical protein